MFSTEGLVVIVTVQRHLTYITLIAVFEQQIFKKPLTSACHQPWQQIYCSLHYHARPKASITISNRGVVLDTPLTILVYYLIH